MTWDFLTHRETHKPKIVIFTPLTEKAIQSFPAIVRELDPYGILDYRPRSKSLCTEPDVRDYLIYYLNLLCYSVQPWHHLLQPNKLSTSKPGLSANRLSTPAITGAESSTPRNPRNQ